MPDVNEIPLTDEQLPPKIDSWEGILIHTDWSLLQDQKEALSDIRAHLVTECHDEHVEVIEGILEFLDCVQDVAAIAIGSEKVFNRCPRCGGGLKHFMKPDETGKGMTEVYGCPECD